MRALPMSPVVLPVLAGALALACQSSEITSVGEPGAGGSAGHGGAGTGGSSAGGGGASAGGGSGGASAGGGSGGGASATGCAHALIVLDRSCSMNKMPAGFTKSKYAVVQELVDTITAQYDTTMAFGLNAFPPLPSEGNKCAAGKVYADIGLHTASQIASAITMIDPALPANQNCGTPTGATLEKLSGYPPLLATNRKHNVILLTDGMPACAGETVERSVTAVQRLRTLGVPTFVIGFLAGANVNSLDMMADAGGVPQPPPATTRYYNAADPTQLEFALRKILSNICSDIPTPTCPPTAPTCSGGTACPAGTTCGSGCCFPIIK